MSEPVPVLYDLTIFEEDGETPIWGDAYVGEIVESSFQTPSDNAPHDRPFLSLPTNGIATEADFLAGAAQIGSVQLRLQDKPTDPADQNTGLITARIRELPGKKVIWRRFIDGEWRIRLRGVIYSATTDPETLTEHILELRDGRQFEKNQRLFFSNHVVFGLNGATGPAVNYGLKPDGTYLLTGVEPHPTTFHTEFSVGVVDLPLGSSAGLHENGLGYPVLDSEGRWRHQDFQVWWRPVGSSDPYTVLRNMPRPFGPGHAVVPAFGGLGLGPEGTDPFFHVGPTLLLSSDDPADLPVDDEDIEILVLAVDITPKTPFWWDDGTLGDIQAEIIAGDHTLTVPKEEYEAAALTAFRANSWQARMRLTKLVDDRRAWSEENIWRPRLVAPVPNVDREIRPVSFEPPDAETGIPILSGTTLQPIGDFIHSLSNSVGAIEFTYVREHLEPFDTILQSDPPPWWKFWAGDGPPVAVRDPEDTRFDWERLVETKVKVTLEVPNALPGAETLVYALDTIRSIANEDGSPPNGDTVSELGNQIAKHILSAVAFRRGRGAPTLEIDAVATDANLERAVGDFVRLRAEWLSGAEGLRGLREVAQIIAITESADPSMIRFKVELCGIPDNTADDDEIGTGTGGEDCLTGGVKLPAPGGLVVRAFSTPGRYSVTNTCDHDVTVDLATIGGGGGGGHTGSGGGGGEGDVLTFDAVVIPAGATVFLDVGEGGDEANGGASTFWLDKVTGLPLDPDVDDPNDAYHAIGGGEGGGNGADGSPGSSGGGAGAFRPTSGGGTSDGGLADGSGNPGGDGEWGGGLATCQRSAGGGGGSKAGAGQPGLTQFGEDTSLAGVGGPSSAVTGWDAITAGGGGQGGVNDAAQGLGPLCSTFTRPGVPGSGIGAGGGGSANGAGATPGAAGIVALRYEGGFANLSAPDISSIEITDAGQVQICVDAGAWAPSAPDGYQVRAEYAVSPTEPDPSSGLWIFVETLTAPGCVLTPPIPTGAKAWGRVKAEAPGYKPSVYSGAEDVDAPETPGGKVSVTVSRQGVATLSWTPNAFSTAQKIRGLVHGEGQDTTRPLALIDGTVVNADSPYTLPDPVPEGSYVTVDVEFWEDNTYAVQGNTERRSALNPERTLVDREDGISALSDVDTTGAAPGALLQLNDYGEWVSVTPAQVIQEFALEESGDPNEVLNGEGEFVPVAAGDGWLEIVAATDQDVTNTTVMQDDAELVIPGVLTGEVYDVVVNFMYAGETNTVDFQAGFKLPAGSYGWYHAHAAESTGAGYFDAGARFSAAAGWNFALGTLASSAIGMGEIRMQVRVGANGAITFQHANNTAGGTWSRRCAGSVLRYRKISP